MAETETPGVREFLAFFARYQEACRNADEEFLRSLLPPGIAKDHFAFVVEMSCSSLLALDASGVEPRIVKTGNRYDVVYEGDLGDGMTEMTLDFYWRDGRWLKFDPDAA